MAGAAEAVGGVEAAPTVVGVEDEAAAGGRVAVVEVASADRGAVMIKASAEDGVAVVEVDSARELQARSLHPSG